jgi:glycine cleavage system H protein
LSLAEILLFYSDPATMNVPDDLRYSESHEWLRLSDDGTGVMGISDHAQAELTDVVYLELPEIGRSVAKGEAIAVIESVKAANDIFSPVSGEVVEVNEGLAEAPEPVNEDPYGAGWMIKIKLSDPAEVDSLLNAESYRERLA